MVFLSALCLGNSDPWLRRKSRAREVHKTLEFQVRPLLTTSRPRVILGSGIGGSRRAPRVRPQGKRSEKGGETKDKDPIPPTKRIYPPSRLDKRLLRPCILRVPTNLGRSGRLLSGMRTTPLKTAEFRARLGLGNKRLLRRRPLPAAAEPDGRRLTAWTASLDWLTLPWHMQDDLVQVTG